MKNVIALLFCLSAFAATGQTTFVEAAKNGFDVESGKLIDGAFDVDGQKFPVFQTGNGSKYLKIRSAKTGNNYPVWIGKETNFVHDGRPVYISKKGSYCVYKLSKNGAPYPVWLKVLGKE